MMREHSPGRGKAVSIEPGVMRDSYRQSRRMDPKLGATPKPVANVVLVVGHPRSATAPAEGPYLQFGKRWFDVVFSIAVLALIGSWLFPLLALAIRLDTRGPVIFRQKRVGLHGAIFSCWKFRTMSWKADDGFTQARKDDPRITRVGRFLRKTNLDELPQFFNVLTGHMSVIGPRPHVPELDHMFDDRVPGYRLRHALKPGVSGLAQVSGCRGETRSVREMKHRIRFDLFYCRNASFRLDLKLVVLTVLSAMKGDSKAY